MNKDYFYFKKFKLRNKEASLKVNTDGVLLGAWAKVGAPNFILDIGTGTGVIALMCKQKSPESTVHGIDIDDISIRESIHNAVVNKDVLGEVFFHKCALQAFVLDEDMINRFDHIICNPPYFKNSTPASSDRKSNAKHDTTLTFEDFWFCVPQLLSQAGRVSVIIPTDISDGFIELAKNQGFTISRRCKISSRIDSKVIRLLIELRRVAYVENAVESKCHIYTEHRMYSGPYRKITEAFYLKF